MGLITGEFIDKVILLVCLVLGGILLVAALRWMGLIKGNIIFENKTTFKKGDQEQQKTFTFGWNERVKEQAEKDRSAAIAIEPSRQSKGPRLTKKIARVDLQILVDAIDNANANIVVSSDDDEFRSASGVAAAIRRRTGEAVRSHLETIRTNGNLDHGDIAVTGGGDWGKAYVVHPVLVSFRRNAYPTLAIISKVAQRALFFAGSSGTGSVAFPVIGGGTGGLSPPKIINRLITEAKKYSARKDHDLDRVSIYVFREADLPWHLRKSWTARLCGYTRSI